MVDNQERARKRIVRRDGREQRLHEIMVRVRFVHETLAVRQNRDEARFGAVDEMREYAPAAALARHARHRHPRRRIRIAELERRPDLFAHAQRVAGVAERRGRKMAFTVRIVREQRSAPLLVLWKAPHREHHTSLGLDQQFAITRLHDGPAHRAALCDEPNQRRVRPDFTARIEGGAKSAVRPTHCR